MAHVLHTFLYQGYDLLYVALKLRQKNRFPQKREKTLLSVTETLLSVIKTLLSAAKDSI